MNTGQPRWFTPKEALPNKQHSDVRVITYDGRESLGTYLTDNNWEVQGYQNDLFNDDIIAWRYI